jgi:hypothetical protein
MKNEYDTFIFPTGLMRYRVIRDFVRLCVFVFVFVFFCRKMEKSRETMERQKHKYKQNITQRNRTNGRQHELPHNTGMKPDVI